MYQCCLCTIVIKPPVLPEISVKPALHGSLRLKIKSNKRTITVCVCVLLYGSGVLLTSCTVFLLFLNATLDAVILLIYVLVASDLAEHTPSLLGKTLLDEPARTLRQKEESQELHQSRQGWQAQHVSVLAERDSHEEKKTPKQQNTVPVSKTL